MYGSGLTTFAVLTFRRGIGGQLLGDALDAGAAPLTYAAAPARSRARRSSTSSSSARTGSPDTFLLVGLVSKAALEQAGAVLAARPDQDLPVITTRNLTKRFGNVEAVREVSLDVREGDRYGLLGPNGSGKSTLVRMLLGLVYATSGEISVLGHRMPEAGEPRPARDRRADRGARRLPAPVRAGQPAAARRGGTAAERAAPGAAASTTPWSRSAWPASTGGRSAPTRSACASGSAWPPRWSAARGCSSSTSRPTASTRVASGTSATCWSA